mmetsp:Transcript_114708/g.171566  ORF Transcript_114708/g.171566 Transcript_114708/m.171566 type:complete len:171 (+) Transcript_114708:615-1127(+)
MISICVQVENKLASANPIEKLRDELAAGAITQEEYDNARDSMRVNLSDISLLEGTFYYEHVTINDSTKNIMERFGIVSISKTGKHNELAINARGRSRKGTKQNKATELHWEGTLNYGGIVNFKEKLATHKGLFVFTGEITEEKQWKGTYFWDFKRKVTGTFSLALISLSQ